MTVEILVGDALERLAELPAESVHCVVTSVPYWGLRKYLDDDHPDKAKEIGLEKSPDEWCARLVEVFRVLRRVLRPDGVVWLNVGDAYAGSWGAQGRNGQMADRSVVSARQIEAHPHKASRTGSIPDGAPYKPKDLLGLPWLLAFALRADGWWLRSEIIWNKPSPMPESVQDRCTKAHEQVFMLTKAPRYFYDAEAIREAHSAPENNGKAFGSGKIGTAKRFDGGGWTSIDKREYNPAGRNARTVWTIASEGFADAHFATMPLELARRCILAGTSAKGCCPACGAPWGRVTEVERHIDIRPMTTGAAKQEALGGMARTTPQGRTCGATTNTTTGWLATCSCNAGDPVPCRVLDIFGGAGTTALAAEQLGRDAVLVELSQDYADMARNRLDRARARRMIGDVTGRAQPLDGQLDMWG